MKPGRRLASHPEDAYIREGASAANHSKQKEGMNPGKPVDRPSCEVLFSPSTATVLKGGAVVIGLGTIEEYDLDVCLKRK